MRFALNVSDAEIQSWLGSLPADLSPGMIQFAEIMAVALRDYGWFIADTAGSAKFQLEAQESALGEWVALGLEAYEASNYQEYPRDLLDGLITQDRIYAIVPSDQYPSPKRVSRRVVISRLRLGLHRSMVPSVLE